MDFNLDRLRTFLVVARTQNLSATARELATTQPNVGRQMVALEKEVGLSLFVRHSRGLYLTKQGEDFRELCLNVVGQIAQGINVIREKDSDPEGTLTILTGTGALEEIIKNLSTFSKKYPKIRFNFSQIINVFQLQMGSSDVSFSPTLFSDPDLIQHHIYDMTLRIYASPTYLDSRPKIETIDDLKQHQLIIYDDEDKNIFNTKTMDPNFLIINPTTMSFYTTPFMKVNSGPSMRDALLNNLGIGAYAYDQRLHNQELLIDVFPDAPDYNIPYYYTYHRRLEGSPKIQAFHKFLKTITENWQRSYEK